MAHVTACAMNSQALPNPLINSRTVRSPALFLLRACFSCTCRQALSVDAAWKHLQVPSRASSQLSERRHSVATTVRRWELGRSSVMRRTDDRQTDRQTDSLCCCCFISFYRTRGSALGARWSVMRVTARDDPPGRPAGRRLTAVQPASIAVASKLDYRWPLTD